MTAINYRSELRQGETVVTTGRFARETPLEVGERIRLHGREGIVQAIQPTLDPGQQRLVIQLLRVH